MKISIGKNDFGSVFPQGDVKDIPKAKSLLKKAGGKPKSCDLDDYSKGGKGSGKPEYIITFDNDPNTIIVVECKNSVKKHKTEKFNKPNSFAVDGALYYAKFLKEEYNVIAIGISGTDTSKFVANTFYWRRNGTSPEKIDRLNDILMEPVNCLKFINGEKFSKEYSIEEIRETALIFHNKLREIKMSERQKPLFIAGILIALEDETFSEEYMSYKSFKSVMNNLNRAIGDVLSDSDLKKDKIDNIKHAFTLIGENHKLKEIPLGHDNSIRWYIEQLELKIKPMMTAVDSTIDALSIFYHEFVKYSGGDGKGLGIVLTPQHLTEFMCDLAGVNRNSKVLDIACGSGSFLVTAMTKMIKDSGSDSELENIRKNNLYGVELDNDLYMLSVANMIIRKDGKSNIIHGDCFNKEIFDNLKKININIGLLNPPYSQTDIVELEFVEQLLNILIIGGTCVVVVPVACAIGTKFKDVRERLFKKHTLKAVFSMPDDIFHPHGTNVCVMVWEAHKPHDSNISTFFGYYKDDGFSKRKKLGRIDYDNRWNSIKEKWINLYEEREIVPGLTAKHTVKHTDEWLCEAYMVTDYTQLTQKDFQHTVNEHLAYLVKSGAFNES
jgi:SAM-dependent methyltransferase